MFGWGDSGEDGKGREGNRGGFKLFGWKGKMGGILGGPIRVCSVGGVEK